MFRIIEIAALAGFAAALVAPAQAGGLEGSYIVDPAEPYVFADTASNNFDGAYVGIVGAAGISNLPIIDKEIAAVAGYNFNMGNGYVAGAEIDASFNPLSLWGPNAFTGTLDGRVGYVVTDDVMLYGRAGGGYTTGGPGSAVWDIGGGAEYALTEKFTVRGELDRVDPFAGGMQTQINAKMGIILDF